MPEKVHCPACYSADDRGEESCRHCGFSAAVCAERYPMQPPAFERLMDAEGLLGKRQRARLDKAIDSFEAKFPQLRIATHLTRLPEGLDVREVGYWLVNFCPLSDGETAENREGTLLFVIDHLNRQAGLTLGYGLDPFLGDDRGHRILSSVKQDLQREDYVGALRGVLRAVQRHFSKNWNLIDQIAGRFRRSPRPDLYASR